MNTLKFNPKLTLAGFGLLLASAVSISAATTVLTETFSYAGQAALMSVWTKADTTVSTPSVGSNAGVFDSPYLTAPNSLISRSLGTTISAATDWTLSFDMSHTAYQRGGWVGLFDTDSKNGYIALWDSGNSTTNANTFSIRSYSSASSLTTWNPSLTNLSGGSITVSNNTKSPIYDATTNSDFVTVTLSWSASTQTLTLGTSIAGTTPVSVSATGLDVANIYIRGNSTVYVDNVSVTAIPEPANIAVIGGVFGLLLGVGRRRRSSTNY
jgi:hypothetical protein